MERLADAYWDYRLAPQGKCTGPGTIAADDADRGQAVAKRKDTRNPVKEAKDIREAVQKELDFDPLVDPTGISVKSMNGDVALNGTVPSYSGNSGNSGTGGNSGDTGGGADYGG